MKRLSIVVLLGNLALAMILTRLTKLMKKAIIKWRQNFTKKPAIERMP
ncbi:MAG: hypothetical protein LBB59_01845 [Campylobacteraceae bacterium]|nr:hypothetical protein [Campylobacteraceae bacterium]